MISSTAIFACSDIEATLAYYKDVLGFDSSWTWDEPPTFGSASMGGVSIMFTLSPDLAQRIRGHEHWFNVEDADDLYGRHTANGAKVVSEIADRPWGAREYVIEDINGYHLRFGGPPSNSAPESNPLPDGISFERRLPSVEEYLAIAGKAFDYKKAALELLERSWSGVVARLPSGEAVGVLRIMHDAPGWFSVWDVAVVPEWQARHIGSEMMKVAMAQVHEVSPGAFVFLFTMKHGFYERLGFKEQTVSMRKV